MRTDTIELALLATVTFYSILALQQRKKWHEFASLTGSSTGLMLASLVSLVVFFNAMISEVQLSRYYVLSTVDRQAFVWVRTPLHPAGS